MKILFDTNIILDLLLDRKPHATFAAGLVAGVEKGILNGVIAATSFTTLDYLLTKQLGRHQTQSLIGNLLKIFEVAAINRVILENALIAKFSDFEDAVLHEAALELGAQAIVTRDVSGFKASAIAVYKPEELLRILDGLKKNSH